MNSQCVLCGDECVVCTGTCHEVAELLGNSCFTIKCS